MQTSNAERLKLLLVGNPGVGKSSIMHRFVDDEFFESYIPTTGQDLNFKTIDLDIPIRLHIWDTGRQRFRTCGVEQIPYRTSEGIFIVYDITNRQSFEDVRLWFQEIENRKLDACIMILGTKCDLTAQRSVTYEEGQTFSEKHNIAHVEVRMFLALIRIHPLSTFRSLLKLL